MRYQTALRPAMPRRPVLLATMCAAGSASAMARSGLIRARGGRRTGLSPDRTTGRQDLAGPLHPDERGENVGLDLSRQRLPVVRVVEEILHGPRFGPVLAPVDHGGPGPACREG